MSRPSLQFRLAALQQTLAAALIVVFSLSAIGFTASTLERQESRFLRDTAGHMLASLDREWNEEADLKRAAASALEEDAPPGVRIDILDAAGRPVASTAARPGRPSVVSGTRTLRLRSARGAWVVATLSTAARREAITALALALLATGVPLFLLVMAASRTLARRALEPLALMTREAERAAAEGMPGALGRPDDPAEVAVLAEAFDRLIERLDAMVLAERHFTEDAAHELRTPLTVVAGELEYVLADTGLEPRLRDGLGRAAEQAASMADLVEALLFLRRSDPRSGTARLEPVPVDLAELARETLRDVLASRPDRVADVRLAASEETLVAGQPVLLASALRNLMVNALKFTAAGQPVEVRVRADGKGCEVIVEDGGPGIPVAERERIFDPFYRGSLARAEQEGSGLGLTILRRIARAHGGDVACIDSRLGGAGFALSLPAWSPGA